MSGRPPPTSGAARTLATVAATLGTLALLAGVSDGRSDGAGAGRVDVARLAHTVQAEEDHVTALELARWIRARKPGLRVIDVRTAAEYADFHVPTAESLSLEDVARADFRPDETVVLYSEGGTHTAQGWFFLRARGLRHVYFLRGGLFEWIQQVTSPVLPADAPAAERAAWPERAALSRYFGGTPRVGAGGSADTQPGGEAADDGGESVALPGRSSTEPPSQPAPGGTAAAVRRIRARGC